MKRPITVLLGLLLAFAAAAEDQILVEAVIVKHPASLTVTKDTWESGKIGNKRGVEVLSRPRLLTRSGEETSITIGLEQSGSSSNRILVGPELRVTPRLEEGIVAFTGSASVREPKGSQPISDGQMTEFLQQQYYFNGSARTGETLVLTSKGVHEKKRISLILKFTKV